MLYTGEAEGTKVLWGMRRHSVTQDYVTDKSVLRVRGKAYCDTRY